VNDLLRRLVRPPPPLEATTLGAWWRAQAEHTASLPAPIDRAFAGGALADRLGYAFAAGYQAALAALFGDRVAAGEVASLCATEEGGNHPKAIATTLERRGDSIVITGAKTWATMSTLAGLLYVVASEPAAGGARPVLRLVRVPAAAAGVSIEPRRPAPVAPEIPHALVRLEGVVLPPEAALEGDGFDRYVRPFRTVEDVHVFAATAGYLSSAGARHGFRGPLRESLYGLAVALRGLAALDPSAPETHLALAGALALARPIFDEATAAFASAAGDEAARWARDRALLAVAETARQKRRERAWQKVAPDAPA
jgi:acyl-CoA dehydrogenase